MPRNGMATGLNPTVVPDTLARFCQRSYPAVDYIALASLAGIWVMVIPWEFEVELRLRY
jgi:diacylglycerol diphosphate phosphatase/phosphatidate phosphatase